MKMQWHVSVGGIDMSSRSGNRCNILLRTAAYRVCLQKIYQRSPVQCFDVSVKLHKLRFPGMEEFKEASMMARKDYQFIAVHGPVREIM